MPPQPTELWRGVRHRATTPSTALSVAVLALLAYIPALTAAPGRMPSDSKLYVYLNPARFLVDTTTTFDPRQYAGWVPHQHIAYLWPTGPWFWTFEQLGVPDWVAHRLWIGTLLIAAGLGVRWAARVLGLGPTAALTAAIVYQLSPYILAYISRTSVLLLPFAGLGWIVGLTVLAGERGRWRFAAGIALVVFTVGAVNATALAMIIPAPTLWLIHATWQRSITWRRAMATAAKVSILSIGVSLWWIVMLVIQGRYGADVLAYSESLESVSFTSTSTEVIRGLGYWLFYIRDAFGATTSASVDYMASAKIIVVGGALLALCLASFVTTAWQHRRFAALLVAVGTILAVGVHPIDSPSPLMSVLLGDGEGGLALALRSSTRAVPVVALGLALSAGALVSACGALTVARPRLPSGRPLRVGTIVALVIILLAIVNMPSLRNGGFVDAQLERDQDPPQAWLDAAARLDELPEGYRVLQLPGSEFGAFRWGYTVDQPLPALTERPLLTRDLLPLGSPAAMDLVFALDDRFQDGTVDVAAVAPIARLLGVDTLWVTDDVAFDRFRLARPEIVDDVLTGAGAADAGLLPAERFGEPRVMTPDIQVVDEQSVSDLRVGAPLATVSLVGVDDPVPTVRAKDRSVVVSGSGDGLVDAAAAGVIDGSELILYSASLDADQLATAIDRSDRLVVTDSNRDRAHHWRSSQDVTGYTEAGGSSAGVLEFESGDQRLAVFDTGDESTQTISIQRGPVVATASSYGEPFAYLPEHRPVMAIDGNLTTSWLVADRAPAIGEYIRLDIADPIDHVTFRQPDTVDGARRVTTVELTVAGVSEPITVELDDRSLTGDGQRLDIDPTKGASQITVTITATAGNDLQGVGFAEIDVGLPPTSEVIRVPTDGLDSLDSLETDTPVTMVFSRLRADPTDRWRSDPEPALVREFTLPRAAEFDAELTLRASQRITEVDLATLLDEPVVASAHLTGVPSARGAAAFDGDASTAWITPFGPSVGSRVDATFDGAATSMAVTQPAGTFSPITGLRVTDPAGSFDIAVSLDTSGSTIELPRSIDLSDISIEITSIDERTTRDRRFGEIVVLPAAISEITFDGASPEVSPDATFDATCRTDIIEVDGTPAGVSFTASAADIVSGAPIDATLCDDVTMAAGVHVISTAPGATTGFNVDRLVLAEPAQESAAGDAPIATIESSSRDGRTVAVSACPTGCWLVLGEGFNVGWSARTDDGSLGEPTLVDGNANGWWIEPTAQPTTVVISWAPQPWLNAALIASLLAVIAAIGLVITDRRRADDPAFATPPARIAERAGLDERSSGHDAEWTIVAATLSCALAIGWRWGLLAAVVCIGARFTRRSRLLAAIGVGIVVLAQVAVVAVVLRERPLPVANWPVRFEALHPWTLFGLVLIASSTLFASDATIPRSRMSPSRQVT